MVNRTLRRLAGSALLLDGLSTLIFGGAYLRRWRFTTRWNRYNRFINMPSGRPGWQLRAAGRPG
jgi:hypothetical protein